MSPSTSNVQTEKEPQEEWPSTCDKVKESYEDCFFRWYRESFLKGVTENPCEELWRAYERCVKRLASSRNLEQLLTSDWNVDEQKAA
ncbi:hypothetical protein GAYE_SCF29G4856 [Galdieria yellowstonensis]|uniref:Uncharacterized protein n=1 Tax=Galdieria yellowstonensis TaxID=3028027 RepID=A0AAV9IHV0_9RHOD|nr:hypothetical protein GAYE_SCF29G4856 [Galdieria yellowstonensis]